ncbi:dihydrolipoyllysine-residue succinyltransferase component of 2-oxoglutarate dehydrogenase complex, mitochondrial-like [Daphnia pulicaria]|uniref:dihydrolipoyllysine-residue succinyltransferase component of 2-oxoglutarate dehydrogenase complex, mitochondrial-like n=1 Tax=Daphnia pulicaria TaxID=35523 RepID=UPI001EEA33B2|nr:dihydrolipoyllysine-residue succinyltransferase component of 2-oxoglutarate dehydrogenase complex, mitochondrial-like [Daphnia pulicaria]
MAALRLSIGSSKQIAKVFRGNFRVSACFKHQETCEIGIQEPSYLSIQQRNDVRCQWNPITVFSRGFRTSAVLGDAKTVMVPPFADSISEGDVRWDKAVGDTVQEDEEVCHIETDKTSIPVKAPCSGVITELCVGDGATVQPGAKLFIMSAGGAAKAAAPAAAAAAPPTPSPAAPAPPPPTPAAQPVSGAIPSTPPPRPSPPTTPISAIPAASIQPRVAAPVNVTQTSQAVPLARLPPADYSKEITGTRTEQRVKMNRMRLRIAQRLKEAQNVNAMLTTFNEIDMSNIMELRKTHGDAFLKVHKIKLGFMSAFVKAAACALADQPTVNAVIDGNEIVYRDYIDISVAVATPKGLVVPVLRNLDSMNYADIEKAIAAMGEKAKNNALAVEDMDGGTFTISNGGVFGSLFGTPIINPPQSAILGMHGIFDRPVARNGQVVIRPMMFVALTYDHRLIDGREAVTFLRKIKQTIEDPRTLLLSI